MKGKTIVAIAVLVLFVVAGAVGTATASGPTTGTSVEQAEGKLKITVVTPGRLDSMQLVAPSETQSLVLGKEGIVAGSRMTLRSNETVYEFFKENNVTIPTTTQEDGFVNITSPEGIPCQDLALQNDDVTRNTSYDRRSAYLACLHDPYRGFEVDGTVIPSNVTIPCHSPALAQLDIIQAGTSEKVGDDTVTTPLILEKGRYRHMGSIGGDCSLIESINVESGEAPNLESGDTKRSETCATEIEPWNKIGGEEQSGGEEIPDFAYLIALALVAGVAAVAYRRFW